MNFDTLEFAAFCTFALLLLNWLRGANARLFAVTILNVIFLSSFATSFVATIPLIAFAVLSYLAILLAARSKGQSLLFLICGLVAIFAWIKKYTVASALPQIPIIYLVVGLSYILFRVLHVMIDVGQGAQRVPRPLAYFAYLFFFLSFVSGPIQRYEDFAKQLAQPKLPASTRDVHRAFNRITLGFFLIMVVTPVTAYLSAHGARYFYEALNQHEARSVALYTVSATTFAAHLYLNFVGYMEIVIGIGVLGGFHLPENFNRPYLAGNFLDFWSRWHITLSEWFKYYVFNPTLKTLAEKWGTPALMPYLGTAAFFTTFLIMGIWHGSTFIYVVYGLFLGFGTAINKIYQVEAGKALGRKSYKALCNTPWYQHLSRAMALSYFIIAITCIWLEPTQQAAMLSARGIATAFASYVVLVSVIWALGYLASYCARLVEIRSPIWPEGHKVGNRLYLAPAWTALRAVAVILLAASMGNSAPEFVYKVF